ncbi:gene transfer agent family protein [Loktanella salsilacus]|uniref:gene transfer agent family protein n=1 Tax=Loktanella salsilacus TaxID=195913 RepID=UPI003703F199
MPEIVREWAGAERPFSLSFGGLMDLEEACGKVGFGEIYLRMARGNYFVRDVYHTIRLALIGGGLSSVEAKRLLDDRFDAVPMNVKVELAVEVVLSVMEGIKPDDTKPTGDPSTPYDVGPLLASFAKLGVAPSALREMSYQDFVHMGRAFGGDAVQPPSEAEFEEMLERMKG